MANRFLDLARAGKIKDEAQLKRVFRDLAKRLHPDGGGDRASAEHFMILRREYEEAMATGLSCPDPAPVEPGEVTPLVYTPRAFYEALEDLLGRGFPKEPRIALPLRQYRASRSRFLGILASRDRAEPCVQAFLRYEEAWISLASRDPQGLSKEVRSSGKLSDFLRHVVYYQTMGLSQALRYAQNEGRRLKGELAAQGERRPLAFIDLLLKDLEKGPCCLRD